MNYNNPDKAKETCLAHYGIEHYMQSEKAQGTMNKTLGFFIRSIHTIYVECVTVIACYRSELVVKIHKNKKNTTNRYCPHG